jgi:hypothetical protein
MRAFIYIYIYFFNQLCAIVALSSFRGQTFPRKYPRKLYGSYVPPEKDPEYKDTSAMPSMSTLSKELENTQPIIDFDFVCPLPAENDIVQYPSKWTGDFDVGRLKSVYYIDKSDMWMSEIIPLIDGKSDNILMVDKKAKLEIQPLSVLKPVRSYFVRSENGYKVSFQKNSTNIVLKAPKYKTPDKDFTFKSKFLNTTVVEEDIKAYSALKTRVLKSTCILGVLSSLLAWPVFGMEVSLPILFGSFSGGLYFVLLGVKADSIGRGIRHNVLTLSFHCCHLIKSSMRYTSRLVSYWHEGNRSSCDIRKFV